MDKIAKEQISELSAIISKNLVQNGLPPLLNSIDFGTLNEFRFYLMNKISQMMDENYDLLINTLYRIDISEEKLTELFAPQNKEFIPSKLADLIIERQLQKIRWRMKYKDDQF